VGVKRIIAIGDLHGDFEVLLIALLKAKCINVKGKWIGGKTFVVQMGDILDRGGRGESVDTKNHREELDILQYLEELHRMAKKKGGAVYSILGNHELMNIMGDFRYTTPNTNMGFGGENRRKELFKPGGEIAKLIACHTYGIIQIGNWVFVHGGILPYHINIFTIGVINDLVKQVILGKRTIEDGKKDSLKQEEKALLFGEEGIFWTRLLSSHIPRCDLVNETMAILGIDNSKGGIVVGHTPQNNINSVCNKRLWKVDNGMSRAFGPRKTDYRIQVLEILNNGRKVNVIK